jgi:transcriptional regulator with XRE-family HTH domain
MSKKGFSINKNDGLKLIMLRESLGLTVIEFAQKAGITSSFINILERGCLPLSIRDNNKIKEAFGLDADWIDTLDISNYVPNSKTNEEKADVENPIKHEDNVTEVTVNNTQETLESLQPSKEVIITDGESLKIARATAGLSRKDIANAIGMTSVLIGYIETGKRTLTVKVKNRLNDFFNNKLSQSTEKKDEALNVNKIIEDIFNLSNDEILTKVKEIKTEKGYTQNVISEKSGVNRSQLSMIENGKLQINEKARTKLLNFISFELTGKTKSLEKDLTKDVSDSAASNIVTENTSVEIILEGNAEAITTETENKKLDVSVTENFTSKDELLKIIESMKKTRDEIDENVKMLESIYQVM